MSSRVVPLLTVCALLAGCASSSGRVWPEPGSGEPGRTRLIVTPASAEAGQTVSISVLNGGDRTLFYGLDNRIERRASGRWVDATKDVFGTANPPVLLILLRARPGELAGPRHNAVADRISLPRSLSPGVYRIAKPVSEDDRFRGPPLMLHALLAVRAASPPDD